MKKRLLAAKAAFTAALKGFLGRFFYTRPALKRGVLVVGLMGPFVVLGHAVAAPLLSVCVAVVLLALFWGMGAERAATDWDPVFSLPPVSAFAFWHWQPLERKRFYAVLFALGICAAISFLGHFLVLVL